MQGMLGLDMASEHRPDLILLDLQLPDMPGDELLRRLQADEKTRHIPVVMVSADATQGQVRRLLALGARRYLTKPLDLRTFLETFGRRAGCQMIVQHGKPREKKLHSFRHLFWKLALEQET